MKSGPMIFLAAFIAVAASFGGFVLAPQVQLGRSVQTNMLGGTLQYPDARPGIAMQGAQVYRENGCMYCHTQQVRQDGTHVEVILTAGGTNTAVTLEAIGKLNPNLASVSPVVLLGGLPKTILQVRNIPAAENAIKALVAGGGKAEARVVPFGPDMSRNWGKRRTVAQDFLLDQPVQPGTRRVGPDLANVGARLTDVNWHLLHLYAPRSVVQGSTMPPYRYLFETRKTKSAPSSGALKLTGELAPAEGYEVVPTDEAKALVAYLISLRADAPLFEAPLTLPPTPPATTNNAVATASTP